MSDFICGSQQQLSGPIMYSYIVAVLRTTQNGLISGISESLNPCETTSKDNGHSPSTS